MAKKNAAIFLVLCLFLACISPVTTVSAGTQAVYYVDPSGGSDINNGTSASTAFATITKARDVVRTINSNLKPDLEPV